MDLSPEARLERDQNTKRHLHGVLNSLQHVWDDPMLAPPLSYDYRDTVTFIRDQADYLSAYRLLLWQIGIPKDMSERIEAKKGKELAEQPELSQQDFYLPATNTAVVPVNFYENVFEVGLSAKVLEMQTLRAVSAATLITNDVIDPYLVAYLFNPKTDVDFSIGYRVVNLGDKLVTIPECVGDYAYILEDTIMRHANSNVYRYLYAGLAFIKSKLVRSKTVEDFNELSTERMDELILQYTSPRVAKIHCNSWEDIRTLLVVRKAAEMGGAERLLSIINKGLDITAIGEDLFLDDEDYFKIKDLTTYSYLLNSISSTYLKIITPVVWKAQNTPNSSALIEMQPNYINLMRKLLNTDFNIWLGVPDKDGIAACEKRSNEFNANDFLHAISTSISDCADIFTDHPGSWDYISDVIEDIIAIYH